MATKVHMEALSPTMEEGQVVKWLKAEGDTVSHGDDPRRDRDRQGHHGAGGPGGRRPPENPPGGGRHRPVGEVIAVIAGRDEDISAIAPGGKAGGDGSSDGEEPSEPSEKAPEEGAAAPAAPAGAGPRDAAGRDVPAAAPPTGGRVKASPVARRLADEAGIDLGRVQGSGPGGRVVKRDVEEAKESAGSRPVFASTGPEYEDVPVSQMRKAIAKRLVQSIGPVPTFYLTIDVDMGRVLEARRGINAMLEETGQKVSINDIVLKATAAALARHPECNAQWHDGFIRRFNAVHLGVAVAIDDGLITPIVRNAHAKGIAHIGGEVRELAGRARDKKLQPDEYTGATFSVSNLGMFGIHEFTAIINPPEAGILAVGGVEETPVVVDGQVVVRPRMRITMSCDHRVIDGAQGSRYLQTLKRMLEEPATILV
jgi:pyruvate dehydrogenase E2 component (dihydrolipoamide acetyltransferase)